MGVTFTERGFAVYDEIGDMYGGTVRVQESSNVEGGVWLHYDYAGNGKPHPMYQNGHICGSPHLSDDQARRVIRALRAHIKRGKQSPAPERDGGKG